MKLGLKSKYVGNYTGQKIKYENLFVQPATFFVSIRYDSDMQMLKIDKQHPFTCMLGK